MDAADTRNELVCHHHINLSASVWSMKESQVHAHSSSSYDCRTDLQLLPTNSLSLLPSNLSYTMSNEQNKNQEAPEYFNYQFVKDSNITIIPSQHICPYSKKPKFYCEVEKNSFNLTWVYSVPCGDCSGKPDEN